MMTMMMMMCQLAEEWQLAIEALEWKAARTLGQWSLCGHPVEGKRTTRYRERKSMRQKKRWEGDDTMLRYRQWDTDIFAEIRTYLPIAFSQTDRQTTTTPMMSTWKKRYKSVVFVDKREEQFEARWSHTNPKQAKTTCCLCTVRSIYQCGFALVLGVYSQTQSPYYGRRRFDTPSIRVCDERGRYQLTAGGEKRRRVNDVNIHVMVCGAKREKTSLEMCAMHVHCVDRMNLEGKMYKMQAIVCWKEEVLWNTLVLCFQYSNVCASMCVCDACVREYAHNISSVYSWQTDTLHQREATMHALCIWVWGGSIYDELCIQCHYDNVTQWIHTSSQDRSPE